jgi:uncharacterized protein with von Willebrand factor type A (vWA) domain
MDAFEERMDCYEEDESARLFDESDMSHTKELTRTVSAIRRFRDSRWRTIQAWEKFELIGLETLRDRWEGYLDTTRGHIAELRAFHVMLNQKLDLFNGMKDGVS